MVYEVDQLERGREQGNVTKNMISFESKADKGEAAGTPMDPIIIGMPPRQKQAEKLGGSLGISERMQEKTFGDPVTEDLENVVHESRWVDDTRPGNNGGS